MQVITIADAVAANGNSDLILPVSYSGHPEAIVQVEITGTATVQILGRIDGDFSFVEVVAASSVDALQPISYFPELRATVSGWSSGTVTVKVLVGDSARA